MVFFEALDTAEVEGEGAKVEVPALHGRPEEPVEIGGVGLQERQVGSASRGRFAKPARREEANTSRGFGCGRSPDGVR
jgi:hypothetical protein